MTTTELDQAKAEAFAGRMAGGSTTRHLTLSMSIGHRTGLFDSLAGLPPSTSEEIANASGLQRAVCPGMARRDGRRRTSSSTSRDRHLRSPRRTRGVVDPGGGRGQHRRDRANGSDARWRRGSRSSSASTTVAGFRTRNSPPSTRSPPSCPRDTVDATLLEGALPLVPGLVERLEAGIDVADIGCGSGYALCVMARAFPNSRFQGFDFSEEAIMAARTQAREWELDNVTFEVRDVTDLSLTAAFDFITTFDAVHDQAAPDRVLAGIADALRPGGVYLCVDIAASSNVEDNADHPMGSFLYTISTMHCMTVSLALDGMGLGAVWGEQTALAMLADSRLRERERRARSRRHLQRLLRRAEELAGLGVGLRFGSGCSHSHCCMRLVVMWSRSRGSPYQVGMHVSGSITTPVLVLRASMLPSPGSIVTERKASVFAVGLDGDELPVGLGLEPPTAFVHQPVVMPTQLREVGEPVAPTTRTPTDVMHVGEQVAAHIPGTDTRGPGRAPPASPGWGSPGSSCPPSSAYPACRPAPR